MSSLKSSRSAKLPPHKSDEEKKKQPLTSKRFAAMHAPAVTWDFFEAFNNSDPCKAALREGEISTTRKNVEKFLDISEKERIRLMQEQNYRPVAKPPEYILNLLAIQGQNGRFDKLLPVLQCLHMPCDGSIVFREENKFIEWEKATAFAVAAFRQQNSFFDQLVEHHDRAYGWLGSNEIVFEARELLHTYQYMEHNDQIAGQERSNLEEADDDVERMNLSTAPSSSSSSSYLGHEAEEEDNASLTSRSAPTAPTTNNNSNSNSNTSSNNHNHSSSSKAKSPLKACHMRGLPDDDDDVFFEGVAAVNPLAEADSQQQREELHQASGAISTADLASSFQQQQQQQHMNMNHQLNQLHAIEELSVGQSVGTGSICIPAHDDGKEGGALSIDIEVDATAATATAKATAMQHSSNSSPNTHGSSPAYDNLQSKLHKLTANRDEMKIAAQAHKVNQLQLKVIDLCIEIEKVIETVSECAERCIASYRTADTRNLRHKQFEELTCMLGEGKAPMPGFEDDWRGRGCIGVRPVMVQFFLSVQVLAEERLRLQELESPQGRGLDDKIHVETNLTRWQLMWNGHDVVMKVLHCLDFLRKCRELSEWYGPSFYFVANPLMLPFNLHKEYAALDMEVKVSDQQQTVPHLRLGNMNLEEKAGWQHQQYLNQWRRRFQGLCEDNWAFNWPTSPDIRESMDNENIYTVITLLYTTSSSSIHKSFAWEKKFISQIHTVRGQDKLLIGENTAKVDKKLVLPPPVARKPRAADILSPAVAAPASRQKQPRSDTKRMSQSQVSMNMNRKGEQAEGGGVGGGQRTRAYSDISEDLTRDSNESTTKEEEDNGAIDKVRVTKPMTQAQAQARQFNQLLAAEEETKERRALKLREEDERLAQQQQKQQQQQQQQQQEHVKTSRTSVASTRMFVMGGRSTITSSTDTRNSNAYSTGYYNQRKQSTSPNRARQSALLLAATGGKSGSSSGSRSKRSTNNANTGRISMTNRTATVLAAGRQSTINEKDASTLSTSPATMTILEDVQERREGTVIADARGSVNTKAIVAAANVVVDAHVDEGGAVTTATGTGTGTGTGMGVSPPVRRRMTRAETIAARRIRRKPSSTTTTTTTTTTSANEAQVGGTIHEGSINTTTATGLTKTVKSPKKNPKKKKPQIKLNLDKGIAGSTGTHDDDRMGFESEDEAEDDDGGYGLVANKTQKLTNFHSSGKNAFAGLPTGAGLDATGMNINTPAALAPSSSAVSTAGSQRKSFGIMKSEEIVDKNSNSNSNSVGMSPGTTSRKSVRINTQPAILQHPSSPPSSSQQLQDVPLTPHQHRSNSILSNGSSRSNRSSSKRNKKMSIASPAVVFEDSDDDGSTTAGHGGQATAATASSSRPGSSIGRKSSANVSRHSHNSNNKNNPPNKNNNAGKNKNNALQQEPSLDDTTASHSLTLASPRSASALIPTTTTTTTAGGGVMAAKAARSRSTAIATATAKQPRSRHSPKKGSKFKPDSLQQSSSTSLLSAQSSSSSNVVTRLPAVKGSGVQQQKLTRRVEQ